MNSAVPLSYDEVFLSYSHDDRELVEKTAEVISGAGFSCWIDKDRLRGAEKYNSAIDLAIDRSIVFVAFLSRTYVNKPYCTHEFDRAIDKQKSILTVCIDDVGESTNRQFAYAFSFSAGHNILRLGTGISSDEGSLEALAGDIIHSVPLEQLKRYTASGDEKDYPPINTPDYILAQLRLYHERQYQQSGNYALNEIRGELFPAIKNKEINVLYRDENKKDVSLIKYFSEMDSSTDGRKHILITGEGGMGKTVSLLKSCEYLLGKRINAIYIPLSKIDEEQTLDQYLERIVCGGNQRIWQDLRNLMSVPYISVPNVVLLLDGINEVPLNYIDTFIKKVIEGTYIDACRGVRLIMTSRWFDNSVMHRLKENVVSLEMQTLDPESIKAYLESMNLSTNVDNKILSVIVTPLMLTLYSDVERHREKYQAIEGIELEDNPDTAGKILGNFFQTQLYRAAEEVNFDRGSHLALLEYFLPSLAAHMLEKQSMYISEDDAWNCIYDMEDDCERYNWYKRDKLRRILRGRNRVDLNSLIDLAENSLHFLHKSDSGYEFLHQSFRDYFAAYHIANEMYAFLRDSDRIKDIHPVLEQSIFPNDIIGLISDITKEENACPLFTENGWQFPGKESTTASKESTAEQLLDLWRNKEGESAQNAVANLINIMKTGRHNLLSRCDFSNLDLRKCWLNKCRFTTWFRDEMYPSIFDGAWIDRTNFLTDGHEAPVSAILSDGRSQVFSGDNSGVVKIYNITEHRWINTLQLQSDTVIDLAWDSRQELLAILYENIVFSYSVKDKAVLDSYGNSSKSKSFRYVRFNEKGEINISFDLEPLLWCDTDGNKLDSDLNYDVPARCARWNPRKKEFVRSNLLQLLSAVQYDENTSSWRIHPALRSRLDEENRIRKQEHRAPIATTYVSLRDAGVSGRGSIRCIQYSEDGSKVLIAIQNFLIEYDMENLEVLNKKSFSSNVQCACYLEDGIAVGTKTNILLLDSKFSEELILQGTQIQPISLIFEDYEENGYYVFSSNGELKKLNYELIVQSMRFTGSKKGVVWIRDRLTNAVQMGFLPFNQYPYGARYSYETNQIEPLGWRYEILDISEQDDDDEQSYYNMDTNLMVIGRNPPYQKIIYTNYTGIWIFGSSFNHIKGDIGTPRNVCFLIQNGGKING